MEITGNSHWQHYFYLISPVLIKIIFENVELLNAYTAFSPIQQQQCIMVQYIFTKVGCGAVISKKICVTAPLQLATLFGWNIEQLAFFSQSCAFCQIEKYFHHNYMHCCMHFFVYAYNLKRAFCWLTSEMTWLFSIFSIWYNGTLLIHHPQASYYQVM